MFALLHSVGAVGAVRVDVAVSIVNFDGAVIEVVEAGEEVEWSVIAKGLAVAAYELGLAGAVDA